MSAIRKIEKFFNVISNTIVNNIYAHLLTSKFIAMTGAKDFVNGPNWVMFTIPRNKSKANRVQIIYNSGSDTYDLLTLVYSSKNLKLTPVSKDEKLTVDQVLPKFSNRTDLKVFLGKMK